jgi:hypothetical protein
MLLFIIGLLTAAFYFSIFIGSHFGIAFLERLVWWAIALPVILAVLAVLTVVIWIGWTMLTTPPLDTEFQREAMEPTEESQKKTQCRNDR